FFFQAEDGIRDLIVTGVQTCALPICLVTSRVDPPTVYIKGEVTKPGRYPLTTNMRVEDLIRIAGGLKRSAYTESADLARFEMNRSEERRVGKECGSRRGAAQYKGNDE